MKKNVTEIDITSSGQLIIGNKVQNITNNIELHVPISELAINVLYYLKLSNISISLSLPLSPSLSIIEANNTRLIVEAIVK
jgi:hypothetical protein